MLDFLNLGQYFLDTVHWLADLLLRKPFTNPIFDSYTDFLEYLADNFGNLGLANFILDLWYSIQGKSFAYIMFGTFIFGALVYKLIKFFTDLVL